MDNPIITDFARRDQRAAELVAGLDSQDLYHVLKALEQRFECRISVIDRTEIGELFVTHSDEGEDLTDDRWAAFRSTEAWEDWNYDTWVLWKEAIGRDAVAQVLGAERPLVYDKTGPIPFPK